MELQKFQQEQRTYYTAHSFRAEQKKNGRGPICEELDAYADAHPEATALELKTVQYETIAERFRPVIFKQTPFFSEMGVRFSEYDGIRAGAGGWLVRRNEHLYRDLAPGLFDRFCAASAVGLHLIYGPYIDPDHHCFPFTAAIRNGLEFYYDAYGKGEQNAFTRAVRRSLLAVKKIAEKFADAAEELRGADDLERRNLAMIAAAARRVPWKKAETFYEGLAALWFLHEVCGSLDGVGMSVVGRPDFLLGDLYRADLEAERIDRETAYDLICRFMAHTDCKLDLERPIQEQFNRGEQGDTLILGGCDEQGNPVCNELSVLFLKAHRELKLTYPKIHCRISRDTPQEFLAEANRDFMNGRNTVSFLNDDVLIPALVKAGKRLEDARSYVAGGCWEVIVEGCEHSQGANCYFNLARVMDLSIHDGGEVEKRLGARFDRLDGTEDFEAVRALVTGNIVRALREMFEAILRGGTVWPEVNPAPFFSACLAGCTESRRDYSAGGARYNPHGVPLAGLAVLADSLSAIRFLCFEKKLCTLPELLAAIRADWNGHDALRAAAATAPRFGDENGCEELAVGILRDIVGEVHRFNREHRSAFQPGLYNYRDIIDWAELTRATPDGRKRGDFLTQGLTPSRYAKGLALTKIFRACAQLPLDEFPANSVLTISCQRSGMTPELLAAVAQCCPAGMLQLNCIDREELVDARLHPEQHGDLLVRLYGYSARFVTLDKPMQEEFMSRVIF